MRPAEHGLHVAAHEHQRRRPLRVQRHRHVRGGILQRAVAEPPAQLPAVPHLRHAPHLRRRLRGPAVQRHRMQPVQHARPERAPHVAIRPVGGDPVVLGGANGAVRGLSDARLERAHLPSEVRRGLHGRQPGAEPPRAAVQPVRDGLRARHLRARVPRAGQPPPLLHVSSAAPSHGVHLRYAPVPT